MSNSAEQLIDRLNFILGVEGGEQSNSPTSKPSDKAFALSGGIYIHKDMDMEKLTDNQVALVHTLLHKFYASGHKKLTKVDIEQLHDKLMENRNHNDFDSLDRK